METILLVAGAFSAGLVAGATMIGQSRKASDAVFSVIAFVLRPSLPFWFWVRSIRTSSSHGWGLTHAGQEIAWLTDGREWVGIFERPERAYRFSPLFLLPAGLVRLGVRLLGRPYEVSLPNRPEQGYIVLGLRVAPGVVLSRRRREDLAYLEREQRYPTSNLSGVPA